MFSKFKKETPTMEIDKTGFVKVTKGMGIEVRMRSQLSLINSKDAFLQDLIFNKFDTGMKIPGIFR